VINPLPAFNPCSPQFLSVIELSMNSPTHFATPEEVGLVPARWEAVRQQVLNRCSDGTLPSAGIIAGRSGAIVEPFFAGQQRLDQTAPIRDDAAFLVASITKPIVAMAALILIERGQMALSDKVIEYIPEFGKNGKNGIRIRHLVTHTSGLPDMLPNNVELREQEAPLSAFVAGTCECELDFAPGKGVKYQSMGLAILGEIVQRVSGMTCAEFVSQEIFEPLGMADSHLGVPGEWFAGDDPIANRIAEIQVPEVQQDAVWNWNRPYWRQLGAPWGGLVTTPGDLAKFCNMMLGHSETAVLAPATIRSATRNQIEVMPDVPEVDRRTRGWGLGWRLSWPAHSANFGDFLGPNTYGHWGATGTVLWIDPDLDAFFVLLTTRPQEPHGKYLAQISNMAAAAFA
jgi:CubicO group peptidase (beta-lactamase class C family)